MDIGERMNTRLRGDIADKFSEECSEDTKRLTLGLSRQNKNHIQDFVLLLVASSEPQLSGFFDLRPCAL